jgi:hypothetical protein
MSLARPAASMPLGVGLLNARRASVAAPVRRPRIRGVHAILVLHDDPEREFDYTAGAERALEQAATDGWTVVSMKNDWTRMF